LFESTFFQFEVQIVLFQFLEDSVDILPVLRNVVVSMDQDVVHIDGYPSFSYFFFEDVIHHGLECCGGVGESEKHYFWFEQSLVGGEGCFPFVSFLDPDIVISPSHIEL